MHSGFRGARSSTPHTKSVLPLQKKMMTKRPCFLQECFLTQNHLKTGVSNLQRNSTMSTFSLLFFCHISPPFSKSHLTYTTTTEKSTLPTTLSKHVMNTIFLLSSMAKMNALTFRHFFLKMIFTYLEVRGGESASIH